MTDRDYMRGEFSGGAFRNPFWVTHPVTKAMMIALAGVHLILALTPLNIRVDIQSALWMSPDDVLRRFQVWRLFTYALVHGDFMHLAFNLLGFWFFGRMVEERLGKKRFGVFCVLACLMSALVYIAFETALQRELPMIGASGIDMAFIVLGAFWMPGLQVIFMIFPVKLWVLAAVLVLIDVFGALEGRSGVAAAAHLGGALFGFLYFRYSGHVDRLFDKIDDADERRRTKKAEKTAREQRELRRELDRILDKVNREGMPSLTSAERKFLKDASNKLR